MAHITHSHTASINLCSVASWIVAPFAAVYHGLIAMAERDPRHKALQRYAAMTDEELAARGLRRETIATHVMRGRAVM